MQALPRIADLSQPDGLFVESLMAAIAQGDDAAKERVRAFLEKQRRQGRRRRHEDAPQRTGTCRSAARWPRPSTTRADGTTLVTLDRAAGRPTRSA